MIDYPKTLDEARTRKYNIWAGNSDGTAYNENQCAYEVLSWVLCFELLYQCSKSPKTGPSNLYCKQHAKMIEGRGK